MDSIRVAHSLIDTVRVITLETDKGWSESLLPWIGILGAIVGFFGSFFAQLYTQNRQHKIEIRKEIFLIKLNLYKELAANLQGIYSVKIDNADPKHPFPMVYEDLVTLNSWLKEVVTFYDKNRLLLDQRTYWEMEKLNRKVIEHRDNAQSHPEPAGSVILQGVGKKNVVELQELVNGVYKAIRNYMKEKYDMEIEVVTVS